MTGRISSRNASSPIRGRERRPGGWAVGARLRQVLQVHWTLRQEIRPGKLPAGKRRPHCLGEGIEYDSRSGSRSRTGRSHDTADVVEIDVPVIIDMPLFEAV